MIIIKIISIKRPYQRSQGGAHAKVGLPLPVQLLDDLLPHDIQDQIPEKMYPDLPW